MTQAIPSTAAQPRAHPWRRRLFLLLKIAVAVGAMTYILLRQPWSELESALRRVAPLAVVAAMVITVLVLVLGTFRWRLLMRAYGADVLPTFRSLLRVYFVGHFYNTYVPGAVGGDVLRGVVTRSAFSQGGATSAVALVFVERALGMLALVSVAAVGAPLNRQAPIGRTLLPYCALAALGAVALVFAVAQGRRFARYVPARMATVLRSLPVLKSPSWVLVAVLLSVVIQLMVVLAGHVLLVSIEPAAPLAQSMLAIPIAAGAAFIPVSAAGVGPRDLALVGVYGALGVPRAAATALAFSYLVTTLLVAAIGGVVQLLAPLETQPQQRVS